MENKQSTKAKAIQQTSDQHPTLQRLGVTFETYANIAARLMADSDSGTRDEWDGIKAAREALILLKACRQELDEGERLKLFHHVSAKNGWGDGPTFDQLAKYIIGQDRANRAREYFERTIGDWNATPEERTRLLKMVKEGKTGEYILRFRDDTIVQKVLDLIKETEIAREGTSSAKSPG